MSIDSYEDVPVNQEAALQKAAANQPITVAIEAGGRDFQFYTSVKSLFLVIIFNLAKEIYILHHEPIDKLRLDPQNKEFTPICYKLSYIIEICHP